MTRAKQEKRGVLDWYSEEYHSGAVNPVNYRESSAYLQGVADTLHFDNANEKERFQRCVDLLHDSACVLENLKRHGVKEP